MRNQKEFDDHEEILICATLAKGKDQVKAQSAQTAPLPPRDVQTETYHRSPDLANSVEVQTQAKEVVLKQAEADQARLMQFLRRVLPRVMKQLSEKVNPALQRYEVRQEQVRRENSVLYQLQDKNYLESIKKQRLEAVALDWSCNGSTLLVAFSAFSHGGGCNHMSYILGWHLNSKGMSEKVASFAFEVSCCVTALACHPTLPNIFAAGNFKGEITCYDLNLEEKSRGRSQVDDYFHNEGVSQLLWWEYRTQSSTVPMHNLLSLSIDSKLLLWDMRLSTNRPLLTHPIKGFAFLRKKDGVVVQVGGLAFAKNPFQRNSFVVGSQAGTVLGTELDNITGDKKQKQLLEQDTGKGVRWASETHVLMLNVPSSSFFELKTHVEDYAVNHKLKEINLQTIYSSRPEMRKLYSNPIKMLYEQHFSSVYCIEFSPLVEDVFATCGLDGQLRIYSLKAKAPLLILEATNDSIMSLAWSPTRPSLIAGASSSGQLFVVDIVKEVKVCQLGQSKDAVLFLRWNQKHPELLAVSVEGGLVRVVQLQDQLVTPKRNQLDAVESKMRDLAQ